MYKLYGLLDPKTNEIRYIGVTTCRLSTRLAGHIYDSRHNQGTYKRNWIKSLLKEGLKPKIMLIEEVSKDEWESKEKHLIYSLPNLTNTHQGGQGIVLDRKEDSIQRSAKAKYIPIVQLTIEGDFIRYWESTILAAKELNILNTSIGNVLGGRTASAGGYRWVYRKDYDTSNYSLKEIGVPSFSYTVVEEDSERVWKSISKLCKELDTRYDIIKKYIDNGLPYNGKLYKIKI